ECSGEVAVVHAIAQFGRRDEIEVVAVIAEDSTAQPAPIVGSGRAQALEFDLQLDRIVHLAAGVAYVAAPDQAGGDAAAFPLHAGDAFDYLAVLDGVVITPHQ